MVCNYLVKHNGIYYSAGENIPTDSTPTEKPVEVKEEKVVDTKTVANKKKK